MTRIDESNKKDSELKVCGKCKTQISTHICSTCIIPLCRICERKHQQTHELNSLALTLVFDEIFFLFSGFGSNKCLSCLKTGDSDKDFISGLSDFSKNEEQKFVYTKSGSLRSVESGLVLTNDLLKRFVYFSRWTGSKEQRWFYSRGYFISDSDGLVLDVSSLDKGNNEPQIILTFVTFHSSLAYLFIYLFYSIIC